METICNCEPSGRAYLAICGHSDRLFESGDENFFWQVQMAQFETQWSKSIWRELGQKKVNDTYLSKHIQNELVSASVKCATDAIVARIK